MSSQSTVPSGATVSEVTRSRVYHISMSDPHTVSGLTLRDTSTPLMFDVRCTRYSLWPRSSDRLADLRSSRVVFASGAVVIEVTMPRIYDVSPTHLLNVPKSTRYDGTEASCYKDYVVPCTAPADLPHQAIVICKLLAVSLSGDARSLKN
jgi:hypothetical protein